MQLWGEKMIKIEKDVLYYVTITDEHGNEQELNLTKEQLTELYGELGKMLSAEYAEDIKEFFEKSKAHKGDEKAVNAVATQEVTEPKIDFNKIWLHSK